MLSTFRAARLLALTALLSLGGCILATDDDDDLGTDESAVVSISAEVQQCRTTCDDSYTQCGVRCVNDQPCVRGCETKKGECYTSCD